ncbi:primosomal protein N' [Pasteurellaceae bacterium USgator11]|nr:primosomal protein N' [Pasteurellaceae bacterium UScroc12]TNG96028.1 primosomal protein N' [Pasteurellaceae bacterium USgator41]TNG98626.1 primosomal protein N' [Pasteurellaceae bacterium UScroc31]TNH00006.1 primosomal protein N' [Pasteurellaceae bacterium USgator11]
MRLVRVALAMPLMHYFDYLIESSAALDIGSRVVVPFGRQKRIAIVVEFPAQSDVAPQQLKRIISVLDASSVFSNELYALLKWSAGYYQTGLGEVLFQALPVKLRQGETAQSAVDAVWKILPQGKIALAQGELTRAKKQQQALQQLAEAAENGVLQREAEFSRAIYKALLEKKWIVEQHLFAQPEAWQTALQQHNWLNQQDKLRLNKQQALAVSAVCVSHGFQCWLLDGVTGSGKTEVYLHLMEHVLQQGKQVLLLIPEIGLTPQIVRHVENRFKLPIDVLHSNLTDSQRLLAWQRAKSGESAVVIGTRSALFTQFQDLGLIILDEEHDLSYKQQDSGWRHHARDLAVMRAKNNHIPLVLGSATPSLESLANVASGKYRHLVLNQRAMNSAVLNHKLLDLKKQRVDRGLSEKLIALMQQHLSKGNQVMLFLNRRGFAPILLCHECGWIAQCEQCDRPFTYHKKNNILSCHHCDRKTKVPRQCAVCGSTHLVTSGMGTEQLEAVLAEKFPDYGIARIDRDSTARKGALEASLAQITTKQSRILIGTQMLAKGHHFPDVTLVAMVNIDGVLFSQDFRSEERLAQLYVQVAGRAGRGSKSGEVVLQTHFPQHPLLQTLLTQGYSAFAQQALQLRQTMGLPPFSAQALFRAKSKSNESAVEYLTALAAFFDDFCRKNAIQGLQLLGPIEALQTKKAGQYQWHLLLQHSSRAVLQHCLTQFSLRRHELNLNRYTRCILDVDPQDFN